LQIQSVHLNSGQSLCHLDGPTAYPGANIENSALFAERKRRQGVAFQYLAKKIVQIILWMEMCEIYR
jgi:hypothetical protein